MGMQDGGPYHLGITVLVPRWCCELKGGGDNDLIVKITTGGGQMAPGRVLSRWW